MILDPALIPPEIRDQIEAGANDLGKSLVWLHDGTEPPNTDIRVLGLAQAFDRALVGIAMMVL